MTAYEPIVQQLVDKLAAEPDFKDALVSSFALAARAAPEYADRGITTLDEYITYMNDYVRWVPTETADSKNVYIHICMFYFVLDMPPVRDWQNAILPSERAPWRWLSQWIIDYAQTMGTWMDKPESLTDASLATFYDAPKYRMEDYIVPDGGWTSFNAFFARNIKDGLRPVASPDDDRVIVNPADCKYDGTWPVGDEGGSASISAKGIEWPIAQLLDDSDNANLGALFAGGVFTHSFLGPTDYHRLHAPVGGTVVEARVIPGLCYLEVILQPDENAKGGRKVKLGMRRFAQDEKHIPAKYRRVPIEKAIEAGAGAGVQALPPLPGVPTDIEAPDSTGYQFLQARGLVLIDNPVLGLVAVLPIGMAQVSSVVLSVNTGDTIQKGQEIGYFQLGGSDIVMVFQKNADVKFEQTIGEWYPFGSRVATGGGL